MRLSLPPRTKPRRPRSIENSGLFPCSMVPQSSTSPPRRSPTGVSKLPFRVPAGWHPPGMNYGTPNPVHAMADLGTHFIQTAEMRLAADRHVRCSHNFGILEGGTSINSIPTTARAKLDLRCAETSILDELTRLLTTSVERSLERENRSSRGLRLSAKIKELGSRPGGKLNEESGLLRAIQSIDAYLDIRSRVDCASPPMPTCLSPWACLPFRLAWAAGRRRPYSRGVVPAGRPGTRPAAHPSPPRFYSRWNSRYTQLIARPF